MKFKRDGHKGKRLRRGKEGIGEVVSQMLEKVRWVDKVKIVIVI